MYVSDELAPKFSSANLNKIFLGVLVAAVVLGAGAGVLLARSAGKNATGTSGNTTASVKSPTQDTRTFRDFAEGTVQKKTVKGDDYSSEGTHILIRTGAMNVALTSSVVDLSEYEGKKVKVFGETQKALKEGWLMDVGRVEVQ